MLPRIECGPSQPSPEAELEAGAEAGAERGRTAAMSGDRDLGKKTPVHRAWQRPP
jgi:hypothetical protein